MPVLQIDLSDLADVQQGIDLLTRYLQTGFLTTTIGSSRSPLMRSMAEMKQKKIWGFLDQVARLTATEYSLPELGVLIGLTSNKVCSLRAILAKPEQRLGIQFFEPAPTGTTDPEGNPRYRMPDAIKSAIQTA